MLCGAASKPVAALRRRRRASGPRVRPKCCCRSRARRQRKRRRVPRQEPARGSGRRVEGYNLAVLFAASVRGPSQAPCSEATSFDHLVGTGGQSWRHLDAERFAIFTLITISYLIGCDKRFLLLNGTRLAGITDLDDQILDPLVGARIA